MRNDLRIWNVLHAPTGRKNQPLNAAIFLILKFGAHEITRSDLFLLLSFSKLAQIWAFLAFLDAFRSIQDGRWRLWATVFTWRNNRARATLMIIFNCPFSRISTPISIELLCRSLLPRFHCRKITYPCEGVIFWRHSTSYSVFFILSEAFCMLWNHCFIVFYSLDHRWMFVKLRGGVASELQLLLRIVRFKIGGLLIRTQIGGHRMSQFRFRSLPTRPICLRIHHVHMWMLIKMNSSHLIQRMLLMQLWITTRPLNFRELKSSWKTIYRILVTR